MIAAEIANVAWSSRAERAPGIFERLTIVFTIVAAIWLASTWSLALLRALTYTTLLVRATIFGLIAVGLLVRRMRSLRDWRPNIQRGSAIAILITVLPLSAWTSFMLWRGAIVPPLTHDALSYHLPKAVLFARADGFRYLTELEARQRNIPANYELLLSEWLITQGADTYTEWPSVAFYLMFVIACGAVAERWWNRRVLVPLVVAMFVAGIPVLLLHSGAHKNDTMLAFFTVAAMVFAGRWLSESHLGSLLLLIASIAMGLGTKPQIAGFAMLLAPFVLVRFVRALRWRTMAAIIVFGVLAFLLLGGAVYVVNLIEVKGLVGQTSQSESIISYGDWANLWQGPYVLLAAPFASSAFALPVPWAPHPWFWRRDEIFFSHLGIPFALCAILALFTAHKLARGERAYERWVITFAAIGAFALMLPVTFRPHGMFIISMPRYLLFLVPVVFGWTIAPAVAFARLRDAYVLFAASIVSFLAYASFTAMNDRFVPLDYVRWAREHPGTRAIPFDQSRAASIVDQVAGPNDKIAADVSYASWVYPAFGAKLTRPVYFIPPGDGPPRIPDDAKWVIVDRGFSIIWEAEGMTDLSVAPGLLQRGHPRAEDLRVRRALLQDPRFELVYVRRGLNQLVFRRR